MAKQLALIADSDAARVQPKLVLPGQITRTGWQLPDGMTVDEWIQCGVVLGKIEGSLQWWLGDWWAYGEHVYGERKALFEEGGPLAELNWSTCHVYGWVAGKVKSVNRLTVLSWKHHFHVAHLPPEQQRKWLARAVEGDDGKPWSSNQLKSAIARQAALDRTKDIELDALALGKFVVLYADPPWRYEHPPMGGSNRSIENHYPTMELEEICALPIADIAHQNSVLFLWATSPKLPECLDVVKAWGFTYRTDMVWVKDKIGMGYHARERHEALLIAKRGELPPPAPEVRPDSVQEAPRLEHSAKPPVFYEIIDRMYPSVRKIELFGRAPEEREHWFTWGNQS